MSNRLLARKLLRKYSINPLEGAVGQIQSQGRESTVTNLAFDESGVFA